MLFSLWIFFGPAATGADWPTWGGSFGRNAAESVSLPDHFDRKTGENIRWIAPLGEVAFGVPTIADGRVFVGTNMAAMGDDARFRGLTGGVLVCLDAETGERLWSLVCPERTTGLPPKTHLIHQRWGLCSSPGVDGDRVYVITPGNDLLCVDVNGMADGNDGVFQEEGAYMTGEGRGAVTLGAEDGDILWRYDIPQELDVAPHDLASSSPLVHEGIVYVCTSNGIGTGSPVYALRRDAPAFISVDGRTGRFLARERVQLGRNLFHAQWGSATRAEIGGRTLLLLGGNDGYCYAFAPYSGDRGLEMVWRFDANPPHYRRDSRGKEIYYYRGDERVYERKKRAGESTEGFNSGDGTFVGPCELLASPVADGHRVFTVLGRDPTHGLGKGAVGCIDGRLAGDISESGLVWHFEDIGRSMSTVAVADGLVYAVDLAGTIYCLDVGMGVLYWRHETGHETWGNPLVADGKVYVNTKRSFWIFAAGRKKTVLFEGRGGSETAPVVANGVVYTFIRGQLYAIGGPA